MNEIKLFDNEELGLSVRAIMNEDGSISASVDDVIVGFGFIKIDKKKDKEYTRLDFPRVNRYIEGFGNEFPKVKKGDFIPESLVYLLGMKANNEKAIKFQQWLATEVIPQIRKTGGYIPISEEESDDEIMAKALLIAQNTIEQKNALIEQMTPKALFYDTVADSKDTISMGEMANILNEKGLGRNNLFEFLRKQKVLMKDNRPYQRYMEAGYFDVIEGKYTDKDGNVHIGITPRVYQKGVDYIIRLVKKQIKNNQQEESA